jgi:transposase InsO family protein
MLGKRARMIVSPELAINIMALYHCHHHGSQTDLLQQFNSHYYVRDSHYMTGVIAGCCRVCARLRVPTKKDFIAGKMLRGHRPLEQLHVDFMFMPKAIWKNRPTKTILSAICPFSQLNLSVIVRNERAATFMDALEGILSLSVAPIEIILSDNQSSLCPNKEVRKFCIERGIKCSLSTPMHSTGNASVEASNRIMRRVIQRLMLMRRVDNWTKVFYEARYLVNTLTRTYARGTESEFRTSALELWTGLDPMHRLNAMSGANRDAAITMQARKHFQTVLDEHFRTMRRAQRKSDESYSPKCAMNVDDVVLLRNLPEDKNAPAFRQMLYKIVGRNNRRLLLTPLYGKKSII